MLSVKHQVIVPHQDLVSSPGGAGDGDRLYHWVVRWRIPLAASQVVGVHVGFNASEPGLAQVRQVMGVYIRPA